jgi:hypothetical protein
VALAGAWLVAIASPPILPWVAGATAVSVLMAAGAWWWPGKVPPRVVAVPGYVIWGILAGLHAWWNALRGDLTPMWEPTRRGVVRRQSGPKNRAPSR